MRNTGNSFIEVNMSARRGSAEKAAAINYHENCGTDINNPTRDTCKCLMEIQRKSESVFSRDITILVKVQASLDVSKPERGCFFLFVAC